MEVVRHGCFQALLQFVLLLVTPALSFSGTPWAKEEVPFSGTSHSETCLFSFVELVGVYGQAWVAVLPVVVVLLPGLDAEAAHRSFCQRFLCLSVNHLVDTHGS